MSVSLSCMPDASEAQAKSPAGDMLVTLLGTGSPVPSATRFGNSTLVQAGGLNLVFDAGRGSHIVRGAPPRIPNVPLNVIAQRTRETYGGPLTIGEDLTRFVIDRDGVAVVPHYAEND